jgi:hypothetical protein
MAAMDPAPDPAVDPAPDQPPKPVTPHAAPVRDAQGRLTYIGDDGRRYVVADPPDLNGDTGETGTSGRPGGQGPSGSAPGR